MTDHIPHLRSVKSTGPRAPIYWRDENGGRHQLERPSRPCGGCQRLTTEGDLVVKYRHTWWHQECATRDIGAGNARQAWLALGHDLARNPGGYRVRDTRAIVGALLGMIADPDEYTEDDFEPAIGGQS